MSAWPTWYHDHTNRLRRIGTSFGNLVENNLEISDPSSFETMAYNISNHDKNDLANVSPPVRTLHEYLQPTQTSTSLFMIFSINAGTFEINLE